MQGQRGASRTLSPPEDAGGQAPWVAADAGQQLLFPSYRWLSEEPTSFALSSESRAEHRALEGVGG